MPELPSPIATRVALPVRVAPLETTVLGAPAPGPNATPANGPRTTPANRPATAETGSPDPDRPSDQGEAPVLHAAGDAPMGVQQPGNVVISDDPEVRIRQSASFWARNPGFQPVFGAGDAIRGALTHVLPKSVMTWISPTAAGFGQPMLDQMRWQIRTDRQPDNPWWLGMNDHLVGDGITAEAYLRAGKADELQSPNHRAWLSYLQAADAARALVGGPAIPDPTTVGDPRLTAPTPVPTRGASGIADAAKGVSLITKLRVKTTLLPQVRRAYWTAHDASIQAAKGESKSLLEGIEGTELREARFSSAWAHTITFLRITNPPAANRLALPVQDALLPGRAPVDTEHESLPRRTFVRLIEHFDNTWTGPKLPASRANRRPAAQ